MGYISIQMEITMNGKERREQIIKIIASSSNPVPGSSLANQLKVSRQVIVQDIALLREGGTNIMSTNRGYIIEHKSQVQRVFKVHHTDEESADELRLFVDCGGMVKDVFVYHHIYGIIKADLNLRSRLDVERYLADLESGRSSYLKKITSDYHYHTIISDDSETLDLIQDRLREKGYLAKLQDYEPDDLKNQDKL